MKNIKIALSVTLFLLAISACEKKSCSHVVCADYQTCAAGECFCPNGYEGDTCSVLSCTKFLGSWNVTENCPDGPSGLTTFYSVSIDTLVIDGPDYLAISNLFGAQGGTSTFLAQIVNNGPNSEGVNLYIPPQNSTNGLIQIQASTGTYYPPTVPGGTASIVLSLTYTYQGNTNTSCIETFRKP